MTKVSGADTKDIVNVATVPQRSPFRYPGGKTWLVPRIRRWLSSLGAPVQELVEPFAGGGVVSLTAVFENLALRSTMVELDDEVAAVWKAILNGYGPLLAERIMGFELSRETVIAAVRAGTNSLHERAFATIIKNRIARGGILAPGAGIVKNGESGKGLRSRWYPATLSRRILDIHAHKDRIQFVHGDGFATMQALGDMPGRAFFIDPPYRSAGRRLYTHSDINHEELFAVASEIKGDILIT